MSATATNGSTTTATPRLGSLVMGTVFLAVGLGTLTGTVLDLDLGGVAAGALIVGGITVIAARVVAARRSARTADTAFGQSDALLGEDDSSFDDDLDADWRDPDAIADQPLK